MSAPVRIPKSSSSPIYKASAKSPHSRSSSVSSSPHASKHSPASSSKDSSSSSSSRRYSRPDLMSSSLKSQDDYLVYEIPSADSDNGLGSVVIIPKSSQGFSWNEGTPSSSLQTNNRRLPIEIPLESIFPETVIKFT